MQARIFAPITARTIHWQAFLLIAICFPASSYSVEDDWLDGVAQGLNGRCDGDYRAIGVIPPKQFEPQGWTEQKKIDYLLNGLKNEKSMKRKLICFKILTERFPVTCVKEIPRIAQDGSLPTPIRVLAIRVAGIRQDSKSIDWIMRLTKSMDPSVRAAALDAIGFITFPRYTGRFHSQYFEGIPGVRIAGSVPVWVDNIYKMRFYKKDLSTMTDSDALKLLQSFFANPVQKIPPIPDDVKKKVAAHLTKQMLQARTNEERVAAARGLAGYHPPKYRLRAAEWGVWVSSGEQFDLAQSVIDEIPPFVYRTEASIAELQKRINQIMIVTKPIIHLTVDQPMSVDVTSFIKHGQPWFSFPRPNDFKLDTGGNQQNSVTNNDFHQKLEWVKAQAVKRPLFGQEAHDGHPWLLPRSPKVGGISGGFRSRGSFHSNQIKAIGVSWQHLIVSPKKARWMLEPGVGAKYSWWSHVREVGTSWVSNGQESERFIYYDGPTKLPSPVRVNETVLDGDKKAYQINFKSQANALDDNQPYLKQPMALLVDVKDKSIRGKSIDFSDAAKGTLQKNKQVAYTKNVTSALDSFKLDESKSREALDKMLTEGDGLTKLEAKGLVQSWEKQFFETPGRRMIVRIPRHDYDFACPWKIFPTPSETARVGLILIELK